MLDSTQPPLTLDELTAAVRAADPTALLVAQRLLRRVIKKHCSLFQLGLRVPHRKTYVIERDELLKTVDGEDLGLASVFELPAMVILLARPEPETLAGMPRVGALITYWRLLFHASVDLVLSRKRLGEGEVRSRIHRIGQVEFDEIRNVLRREKYLLPPRDNTKVYSEFAAVYLELRYFAPHLLPDWFPSLTNYDAIDLLLAQDVDAAVIFAQTRLPGAPQHPAPTISLEDEGDEPTLPALGRPAERLADEPRHRRLTRQAEQTSSVGNVVRAALLHMRAAQAAKLQRVDDSRDAARECVNQLVLRLQAALQLSDHEVGPWRQGLLPLLRPASEGLWPLEARALYDLQKVCIDHERVIHAVDVVEWARTLGRRPLKRPLPGQREWLIVKDLRSAQRRLRGARVTEKERRAVLALVTRAIHHAEAALRTFFRPRVQKAVAEVNMTPANYPERIALQKLIEEVLDRIVATGYLTIGDLRDAVSRNNLKLPDLSGPVELIAGDKLLQLDKRMVEHLDGVYRRGEIYLRGLQRLTALAFGNSLGRFLTLFVLLPFGCSWGTFETVQHVLHPIAHYYEWGDIQLDDPLSIVLLGHFLLLLFNSQTCRSLIWRGLVAFYRAVKALVYDLPAFVLSHRWLRAVWEHGFTQFVFRLLVKPALLALPVFLVFVLIRQNWYTTLTWSAIAFLIANWTLNSRMGRNFEEILLDWLLHNWERVTADLLPGLFRFVWDLFKRGLETIDRLLYSVDEWLRFRSGEGWTSFYAKLVLGFFWFWITYLLRIYINVLIEPHFNPIKHFPAVTIGAKILLPLTIPLTQLFAIPLEPLGPYLANSIAFIHVWMLPGVFGFLVWEMQANWRLYAANRAKTLRPVVIGSHGETLGRLLRPGFHSGTIPKLYSRLRRASRRAARFAVWRSPRKYKDELHHVEESLHHFVEREFVALLDGSKRWHGRQLSVGTIHVGTNCIRLELVCEDAPEKTRLILAEQSGWLIAGVEEPGWLPQLDAEERATLTDALVGLYLLSGIELTREQLIITLGQPTPPYDIMDQGLAVWPDAKMETEVVYDLTGPDVARLLVTQVLFSEVHVTWEKWVETWERDQVGKSAPLAVEVAVLPG